MNAPLALVLVVAVAAVCGVALWSVPAAAAATPAADPAAGRTAPADDIAGHEGELARTVLALLPDEQRLRAIVGTAVVAEVMLRGAVTATDAAVGGGIPVAAMPDLPQRLALRLLRHAGDVLATGRHLSHQGLTFAFAGSRAAGAPFYVRLHGRDFAVEWLVDAGGVLHGACRDLAGDTRPWLREQVFGGGR